MGQYIAIVSNSNNRITKYAEFTLEADADAHVVTFGGFVYNNSNNYAIPSIHVDGSTVTSVDPVSLADYKTNAISVNQDEAATRIAALFSRVYGSNKFTDERLNLVAEYAGLTMKVAKSTNDSTDDARIVVLEALDTSKNAVILAENKAATRINAAANKKAVDAISVPWP